MRVGLAVPHQIESAARAGAAGEPPHFPRRQESEAPGIDDRVSLVAAELELTFHDNDALVGIVEMRRDDVAGREPDQQVHAACLWIGAEHDAFGTGHCALVVDPVGGTEVRHNGFGRRLAEGDCAGGEEQQELYWPDSYFLHRCSQYQVLWTGVLYECDRFVAE